MNRRRVSAVLVLAACALTACGSTVRNVGGAAVAVTDDGLGTVTPQITPETGGPDARVVPPTDVPTSSTDAGASTDNPVGTDGGSVSTSAPITRGGPVNSSPILIGVYTIQGFSDFAAALGSSATTGDQQAQAQAMINDINAHGGIGGRKITPVFHDFNVGAAATDLNSEYQAACTAWTQDHKVAAVINNTGTTTDLLYKCLSKAGVPTFASSEPRDERFYKKYSAYFYAPGLMTTTRSLSTLVDAMHSAGFFGTKPKVGVIVSNLESDKTSVTDGLKPALQRAGYQLADSVEIANDTSYTSASRAAVLRFKAEGITHVFFSALSAASTVITAANNNNYHPRYAVTSYNGPQITIGANVPASELNNVWGIGWNPFDDVSLADDPGTSAPQGQCYKVMATVNEKPQGRYEALSMTDYCDTFRLLQLAIGKGVPFTVGNLRTGVESLRTFPAATTFRSGFAPGRHDGVLGYRLVRGSTGCKCVRYAGPLTQ